MKKSRHKIVGRMYAHRVSEVLRTSVQHYYDTVRAQRSGLKHLRAFIGQGDSGRSDIASSYKDRLADSWGAASRGQATPTSGSFQAKLRSCSGA